MSRRRAGPSGAVCERRAVAPAEQDADDIGQRVPADGERADLDQHRIDGGEGQQIQHRAGEVGAACDSGKALSLSIASHGMKTSHGMKNRIRDREGDMIPGLQRRG